MKINYKSPYYNEDAFRCVVTTKFKKDDLRKHHIHPNTAYRVLLVFAGCVTRKNNKIWGKSLDFIAKNAGVCKESAIKAVNFLADIGQIRLEKGKSRYSNQYWFKYPETGVYHTKNGAKLPFITLSDHLLMKKLQYSGKLSKTALSFLPYVLLHAGKSNGFHASKKTILDYSGRDRRTLNKAYKELIEKEIFKEREFFKLWRKLPSCKGQAGYQINRSKLLEFTKPQNIEPDKPIKNTA